VSVPSPVDPLRPLSLEWGDTSEYPTWDAKELAPRDLGGVSVDHDQSPQTVSVPPIRRPGRYDLRFFNGSVLLDVLSIAVE
jgi:hypothetical protein